MPDTSRPDTAVLVPPALLDPVVAYFNPRRVIMFGSAARGQAGPDSDVDLLVVVDDDTQADRVTLKAGYEARKFYSQPADVIPAWESTFQKTPGSPAPCPGQLFWMGLSCMSDPDPLALWRRVKGWTGHAEGSPHSFSLVRWPSPGRRSISRAASAEGSHRRGGKNPRGRGNDISRRAIFRQAVH
jgi:uncharacterized protein